MTTTKTPRIGPKMFAAVYTLAVRFGGSLRGKHNLAKAVGPHGSNNFGDRIVWRAICAGLIATETDEKGIHTLTLTDAGLDLLGDTTRRLAGVR